jgi:glycosyltransferase involved in cell wall biosynthesis
VWQVESVDLAPERREARGKPQADTSAPVDEIAVLVLIDHLVMGGAEMLLSQFAKAAPAAGIQLTVASLDELEGNPAAGPLRQAGVEPINLGLPGRPNLHAAATVRRHFAAVRPDIVHTHLGDAALIGGVAGRSLRIPVVSTIHTIEWGRDLQTRLRQEVVKRCAARVVAVSDTASRIYAERGFSRPGQLVTIRNGVDAGAMPGAGKEVRRELGWSGEDLVVGMVSTLRPVKAHDVAIAAISRLSDQYPALKLLIVGGGPAWDEIARLAGPLGDRVAMVGRQTNVMRYLDAADVCLHPSHAEAFPTTLIEAMAASASVLATAVGGIPEIVEDGSTGVLIPPPPSADAVARALASLLADPHRRRILGEAGRRAYEARFTAGPWVRATREMYDAVLAQRRR